MRNLIILVAILIATLEIHSQDRIDPSSYFNALSQPDNNIFTLFFGA